MLECNIINWFHRRTSQKNLGGNQVLPKFCDICPNHDFLAHYGKDKEIVEDSRTKNKFCPKIMLISKQKKIEKSSVEFSLIFFNF